MAVTVRALTPDDAALYREIRLEALRAHPEAFTASLDVEASRPLDFFAGRLSANTVFGGLADGRLLGTAGFRAGEGEKQRHKATLWGMYVRPEARRTGLARQLVDAVVGHACGRAEQVHLTVTAGNVPAERLYRAAGFIRYGTEPRALRVNGRYWDEVLMVKTLA